MAKNITDKASDDVVVDGMAPERLSTPSWEPEPHSPKFYIYRDRYRRGGCTLYQLRRLVEVKLLKAWEYKQISGVEF